MKRIFICLLAALTALVLICSCANTSAPASSEMSHPTEENSAADKLLSTLTETATIYEINCRGLNFYKDGDPHELIYFPYGWLKYYDLREKFGKESTELFETVYKLPQPLAEEICKLFFDVDITDANDTLSLEYSSLFDSDFSAPFKLSPPKALPEPLQDGSYTITFERVCENGVTLCPVTYKFTPHIIDYEPTAPISSRYHEGDTVYQISSVKNLKRETLSKDSFPTEEIFTVDELFSLAEKINSGSRDAQQKIYVLKNDLDLSGMDFEPIGKNRAVLIDEKHRDDSFSGFCAVFDGQNHTISNLGINVIGNGIDSVNDTGLFSLIGENGEVKNLILENARISPKALDSGAPNYLVNAGLLAGSCAGTIDNCHVSGSVWGGYCVGGIAGSIGNYDLYENEDFFATVTNCTANAQITGESEIGVFAGSLHGAKITDCSAQGEVTAVSGSLYDAPRAIGGFAGFSVEGIITDCNSDCYIKTMVPSHWVGAFMGYNQGKIYSSRYNLDKAPYWESVDVIYQNAISQVSAYSRNVTPINKASSAKKENTND